MRSSRQTRWRSSRWAASTRANGSENSASAGPRQSASAARSRAAAVAASPSSSAARPSALQALEAHDVDRLRVDVERVAGLAGLQRPGRQRLAQRRDVDVDHLDRRLRDVLAPQVVDEALDRDRPVGVQQQPREQRARLATPELERLAVAVEHLQRTEHAEVHRVAAHATRLPGVYRAPTERWRAARALRVHDRPPPSSTPWAPPSPASPSSPPTAAARRSGARSARCAPSRPSRRCCWSRSAPTRRSSPRSTRAARSPSTSSPIARPALAEAFAGRGDRRTRSAARLVAADRRRAAAAARRRRPLQLRRRRRTTVAGTHTLVLGAVTRAERGAATPLAYTRRGYVAPSTTERLAA